MRHLARLLLVLVLAGGSPAGAASPWARVADPVFVQTDTRELPDAAVMSLAQDSAGFLWVGTQGGLARYDGYHFHNYVPNPSDPAALPDGFVRKLLADADGGVWIGSSSNGLVHYSADTANFRTWHPDPAGRTGPRSASIDALAHAGGDALWVGGDGGLDRFDPQSGTFAPVALDARGAPPVVWSILVDRAGAVWAGTQTGLFVRRPGATRFVAYPLHLPGRSAPRISSLYEDGGGRLWAGSVSALFAIDPSRSAVRVVLPHADERSSLAPGQQLSIVEVTPGTLWVGTDAALSILDTATGRVRRVDASPNVPGTLTEGRVVQFLRDRSGMMWIANHVGGLLLYNPGSRGLYQINGAARGPDAGGEWALAVDAPADGRLWVGGVRGRLAIFRAPEPGSQPVAVPNHASVQAIATAHDGRAWIGTSDGLCRLDPSAATVDCSNIPAPLSGMSVYALAADGNRLFVGGGSGLYVEDLRSGRVAPYPGVARAGHGLSNDQIRALFLDRKHRLWVGTEDGLNRVDPGGTIVRFVFSQTDPDSIGPGGIATVVEDRRGRIWAGANGGPLNVINEDAAGRTTVRHIGLAQGMPHENVDGLAEDPSGKMWASTDRGIASIDPDTLLARAYGRADGVTDSGFWATSVAQSPDGTIFFGGLDGVTIVDPHAASDWTYAPPLVATALEVGRQSASTRDVNHGDATIDLAPDGREITTEFAALDYSAPQALRYQYRLDGYDRDWVDADATHRVATYTHLSPGRYTLVVRGTNRLGVWSAHELRFTVNVAPAWYETWWLRAIVALLALLGAYGVYRLRTGVLHRRQRELESLVADRTRALSDANDKLNELSLSDPLTGLRNRRFLDQHLDSDIAITLRRYEDWVAQPGSEEPDESDILFFLVDLDNFKSVNDRHGHNAGDAVLVQMRARLQEVFRESDFVVRWGGDEFLTVARGIRRGEASRLAERIREVVEGAPFELGGEQTMPATASIGFAAFPFVPRRPSALTWYQVVGLADHALYMAKIAGRNAWYGLAASAETDPAELVKRLDGPADALVKAAALIVDHGALRRV